MKNAVIYLLSICVLAGVMMTASYFYTAEAGEFFTSSLNKAGQQQDMVRMAEELSDILSAWEKEKKRLMFILNHKDVENVTVYLIRAEQFSRAFERSQAVREIEMAAFLVRELIEKERATIENIL